MTLRMQWTLIGLCLTQSALLVTVSVMLIRTSLLCG